MAHRQRADRRPTRMAVLARRRSRSPAARRAAVTLPLHPLAIIYFSANYLAESSEVPP